MIVRIWAIYRSPPGAPEPFAVVLWSGEGGRCSRQAEPAFFGSIELARQSLPDGLEQRARKTKKDEARLLIETWEVPKNERRKRSTPARAES